MKHTIAALGLVTLLSGCMYSPAESYGIRHAVLQKQEPANLDAAPLHTAASSMANAAVAPDADR